MGQKINSNIFRLGIKKNEWKSKYFEKTKEEFSLYAYQSLEIKKFLQKFLTLNGLNFHDFKIRYSGNTIYLYISYYTTSKITSLINNNYLSQKFKLKKHKLPKKLNLRTRAKKQSNLLKKRIRVLNNYKNNLKVKSYKNTKHLKSNNFSEQLLESLSVYTNKKFNIFITFQNINKGLSLNLTDFQAKFLEKKLLGLRRESRNQFFKETVNILVISVTKRNSAQLLAEFIAYQLSIMKRHSFFLIFIKRFLITLISEKNFQTFMELNLL